MSIPMKVIEAAVVVGEWIAKVAKRAAEKRREKRRERAAR